MAKNTDPAFHNKDYRTHRAKLLMERERSLLPATQEIVLTVKKRDKVLDQIGELQAENDMLAQLMHDNRNKIQRLRQSIQGDTIQPTEKKTTKPRYIAHCPVEECEGFIGEKWKCGICEGYACRKCHQPKAARKDPDHKCNKDDVETAKLLANDTKPCPNCSVPIFKISGCDQMWCTSCHTPFSWKTGKVETGVVHNPHFYQFQRNANGGVAPRARGDVRCGGAPDIWAIRNHFQTIRFEMPPWLETARRMIDHVRGVELIAHPDDQGEQTHQDLRVKFLMKK
ncbi:MAG: Rcat domain-containing protein, partial [Planctomycetota bacterium]